MEHEPYIFISEFTEKIASATSFDGKTKVKFKQMKEGTFLYPGKDFDASIDGIIKLKLK